MKIEFLQSMLRRNSLEIMICEDKAEHLSDLFRYHEDKYFLNEARKLRSKALKLSYIQKAIKQDIKRLVEEGRQ